MVTPNINLTAAQTLGAAKKHLQFHLCETLKKNSPVTAVIEKVEQNEYDWLVQCES